MYKVLKGLIYAGLGLAVLAVGAALLAPRFIDWKSYTAEIEAEASRLTGHKVIIGGALDLDLLPSPSLTAEDVTVAGAPGTAPLARIGRLDIKVALLPLLAGRVEATSVVLVEPRITLAGGNWKAAPVGKTAGGAKSAAGDAGGDLSFSLKDVRLRDGTVSIARKGAPPAVARKIDMRLSAETLQGPFRGAGTLTAGKLPLRVEFSAARAEADGAIPLTIAVLPPGGGNPGRIFLQGDLVRPGPEAQFAGKLRLEAKSSRAPAAAFLSMLGVPLPDKTLTGPMTGEATLTASASGFRIGGLVLDLAGTSVRADVDMRFGDEGARRPAAKVTAAISRVDLDALIAAFAAMEGPGGGEESGSGGGTGGGSAAAPPGYRGIEIGGSIDFDLNLSVDALVLNRSVIRGVSAQARLASGKLSIRGLTALLPGAAKIEIAGAMREDGGFTRFQGTIDAEAGNLRGMLDWLAVDIAGTPADRLRQSSLKAKLTISSDGMTLRDIRAAVDLTEIKGKVGVLLAARPKVEVEIEMGALDLDAYTPRALPAPAASGKEAAKPASQGEDNGTVAAIDWHKLVAGADIDLRVSTTALTAQGRALGPTELSYESGKDGARLRDLTLADVGGTSVKLSGEKMRTGGRTAMEGKVVIADLGKLASFAGANVEGLPKGAVTTSLRLSQEKADGAWALSLTSEHAEGVATVTGRGKITETDGRRRIAADLAASEIDAGLVFALLSSRGAAGGKPGETPAAGRSGAGTSGGAAPEPEGWSRSAIDLTMLHALDLALKIKASTLKAGDLRIEAPRLTVDLDRGRLRVTDIAGKLYGGVLTGELALDARAIPKAEVALAITGVDLNRVVGAVRFREKEIVGLAAGRADAALKLAGEGASMAALMSSLSGSASLKADEGVVKGFDLALANRQISGRQGNFGILGLISVAMTRGSTKFKALSAAAAIKAGRITVTKGALDAEGGDGALAGVVDLGGRTVDLRSEFRFDSIAKAPPLEMRVSGAFGATRSVIDVKALTAWLRANPPGGN